MIDQSIKKGEINYESIGSKKYKKILWKGA